MSHKHELLAADAAIAELLALDAERERVAERRLELVFKCRPDLPRAFQHVIGASDAGVDRRRALLQRLGQALGGQRSVACKREQRLPRARQHRVPPRAPRVRHQRALAQPRARPGARRAHLGDHRAAVLRAVERLRELDGEVLQADAHPAARDVALRGHLVDDEHAPSQCACRLRVFHGTTRR